MARVPVRASGCGRSDGLGLLSLQQGWRVAPKDANVGGFTRPCADRASGNSGPLAAGLSELSNAVRGEQASGSRLAVSLLWSVDRSACMSCVPISCVETAVASGCMTSVELLRSGDVVRRYVDGSVQLLVATPARPHWDVDVPAAPPLPPAVPRSVNPYGEWHRQSIWGPVVCSVHCAACRGGFDHRHGYYASIGGE